MKYQEINIEISDKCQGKRADKTPKLYAYIPSNSVEIDINRKRKTVLICPGGGYRLVSDREAEPIALKLVGEGFNAFVLRYSVAPASFPTALCEIATAMSMLREHKEEWNIDEDHIIVAGFSAGGHLAGSLATLWHTDFLESQTGLKKEQYKPNGVMLAYPVITAGEYAHKNSFENLLQEDELFEEMVSLENNVTNYMPPTFMWHTYDDAGVPVENSLLFATALNKHKISLELHIYPHGVHGLSLANELTCLDSMDACINKSCQSWMPLFITWLKSL